MAVIAGVLGRAGQRGQRRRLKAAEEGEITWQTPTEIGKFMQLDMEQRKAEQKKLRQEAKKNLSGETSAAELEAFSYFQKQRDEAAKKSSPTPQQQPESSS